MSTKTQDAERITDTFRGDNNNLVRSIKALLELDAQGSLVPHGVGGHARGLLSSAAARLAALDASAEHARSISSEVSDKQEAIYQVLRVGRDDVWCDVERSVFDRFTPNSRRIVYASPHSVESDKQEASTCLDNSAEAARIAELERDIAENDALIDELREKLASYESNKQEAVRAIEGIQRYKESSSEGGGVYENEEGDFIRLSDALAAFASAEQDRIDAERFRMAVECGYLNKFQVLGISQRIDMGKGASK
jgi:hypothetical protein